MTAGMGGGLGDGPTGSIFSIYNRSVPITAYTLDPAKLDWADCVAVQA